REYGPLIAVVAATMAVWEYASRSGLISSFVLPAPSTIAGSVLEHQDLLIRASLVTLWEIVAGFLAGSFLGFVMGLGIFYSSILRKLLYPLALLFQTIPKVALAPLFIVWFGVGFLPIFLIAALVCLFPVLINTVMG